MAAKQTNRTPRFVLKSIPSFLPERLSIKSDDMAQITPAHWVRLSRSPNIIIAPTSVITGRVACIGAAIVRGNSFRPKYPKIHEANTRIALIKTVLWSSRVPNDMAKRVPSNHPKSKIELMTTGENRMVENSVLSSRTLSTAFALRACFFATSYSPSSEADIKARIIHIVLTNNKLRDSKDCKCKACNAIECTESDTYIALFGRCY